MMFVIFVVVLVQLCIVQGLRMSMERHTVLKPFTEGRALKIISGLTNFDETVVKNVAVAALVGGATHIDIACDPALVQAAKAVSTVPICVSSISPSEFVKAVQAGADMVEIGNFDGFYDAGMMFTAEDVLALTKETRALLPNIPLSVTIPHTLSMTEQIALAKALEIAGADIIQTEGKVAALERSSGVGITEMMEMATPALASAYALSRAVRIPVMAASGLTDVTAPLALAAGARGVGIGSMVNRLKNKEEMIMAVKSVADAMGLTSTVSSEGSADIAVQGQVNKNVGVAQRAL